MQDARTFVSEKVCAEEIGRKHTTTCGNGGVKCGNSMNANGDYLLIQVCESYCVTDFAICLLMTFNDI